MNNPLNHELKPHSKTLQGTSKAHLLFLADRAKSLEKSMIDPTTQWAWENYIVQSLPLSSREVYNHLKNKIGALEISPEEAHNN